MIATHVFPHSNNDSAFIYTICYPGISFYKGGKLNLQIGQANLTFIHYTFSNTLTLRSDTCSRHVVWKTCPHGVLATFLPRTFALNATVSPPLVTGKLGNSIGCIQIAQSCRFPSSNPSSSSSKCGAK